MWKVSTPPDCNCLHIKMFIILIWGKRIRNFLFIFMSYNSLSMSDTCKKKKLVVIHAAPSICYTFIWLSLKLYIFAKILLFVDYALFLYVLDFIYHVFLLNYNIISVQLYIITDALKILNWDRLNGWFFFFKSISDARSAQQSTNNCSCRHFLKIWLFT